MLIDTHAHLFEDRFHSDLSSVLKRAEAAGVQHADLHRHRPRDFDCQRSPGESISAARCRGWHSTESRGGSPVGRLGRSREPGATEPRVVAIGETGLDRYWDRTPFDVQEDYFARHIALARRLGKPFVIHCREAEPDVVRMLRGEFEVHGPIRAVMHSFSGDLATAHACLDMGLFISFAGMVTYKTAQSLRDVAREVPLDRLLVETDCPYLAPAPHRGKRNEPAYVAHTTACLAEVKGLSEAALGEATTKNAKVLFGLE